MLCVPCWIRRSAPQTSDGLPALPFPLIKTANRISGSPFWVFAQRKINADTAPSQDLHSALTSAHKLRLCVRRRGCSSLPAPPGNTRLPEEHPATPSSLPEGLLSPPANGSKTRLMIVIVSARVIGAFGRKRPSGSPCIHPSCAARRISLSAQCPEMSVKLLSPSLVPVSNRAQIAANSARVMASWGANVSSVYPFTTPSAAIVDTALLYHAPCSTSAKPLRSVKYSSRTSSFQQPEENRRRFRTGDVGQRTDITFVVTDNIGKMIRTVEPVRHAGGFPSRHRPSCSRSF